MKKIVMQARVKPPAVEPIAGRLLATLFCALVMFTPGCGDKTTAPSGGIDLGTETRVGFEVRPNAIHPIAGRSAFPEPGETLEQPIAAKRLSSEEQFAMPIDPADIPAVVAWDQAARYLGHEITVQGRIVHLGRSGDGNVHFLNFDKDWRGKFYMVIFDDLAKTLDQPVEAMFKDKVVRVKGKVEPHRGNPQIKITSMDQVEFIDE